VNGVFQIRRGDQIVHGGFDHTGEKTAGHLQLAAIEEFKKAQGVLALLTGSLLENRSDLHETVFGGLIRKKGVAGGRLGFEGI
jgi:glycine cleavage system H lipoate-binding protein